MSTSIAPFLLIILVLIAGCISHQPPPQGDPTAVAGMWKAELDGRFHLDLDLTPTTLTITDGDVSNDIVVIPSGFSFDGTTFAFEFDHSPFMPPSVHPPSPGHGTFTMSATVTGDTMAGTGTRADGKAFDWTAVRVGRLPNE